MTSINNKGNVNIVPALWECRTGELNVRQDLLPSDCSYYCKIPDLGELTHFGWFAHYSQPLRERIPILSHPLGRASHEVCDQLTERFPEQSQEIAEARNRLSEYFLKENKKGAGEFLDTDIKSQKALEEFLREEYPDQTLGLDFSGSNLDYGQTYFSRYFPNISMMAVTKFQFIENGHLADHTNLGLLKHLFVSTSLSPVRKTDYHGFEHLKEDEKKVFWVGERYHYWQKDSEGKVRTQDIWRNSYGPRQIEGQDVELSFRQMVSKGRYPIKFVRNTTQIREHAVRFRDLLEFMKTNTDTLQELSVATRHIDHYEELCRKFNQAPYSFPLPLVEQERIKTAYQKGIERCTQDIDRINATLKEKAPQIL